MADGVDAERNRMQATHREPMIYSVFPNSTLQQLPSRDHPVLSPRQLSNERVGLTKPPQPVYFAG